MADDKMIAALLRERAGCVVRGLDARVVAIDEQLEIHGYEGDLGREAGGGDPDKGPPKKRAPRSRQTAQQSGDGKSEVSDGGRADAE